MSKEAIIIQSFNDVKQQYEYSVKGYDVTESVKILLKRHKEEYDKEKNVFAGIQGFIEAQQLYENDLVDLEAKLAESEKQIKDAREAGNMAVDSWCKNRRKYEAQIAEMQNKSFILYSMLYETLEKQGCENVASQIDQMTGWTYDKEADWLKGNRNYDQLKQQLAEKEKRCEICGSKMILGELGYYCSNTELHNIYPAPNEAKPDYEEITLLKQDYDAMVEREELLRQQLAEKEKEIESLKHFKVTIGTMETNQVDISSTTYIDQDKISFALEQLEKVKEFFLEEHRDEEIDTDYIITKDAGEIADYLLDQINELKEGK